LQIVDNHRPRRGDRRRAAAARRREAAQARAAAHIVDNLQTAA
jgi:hypothetical protein